METRYEFILYEIRPEGRNPNDVVLSSRPIYRTTTDLAQLVYGPAEPLLQEDMSYAWQVRAIDTGGRDAFRNNGYSEVCTFTYGGIDPAFNIGAVAGLQAEGESERRARIWWEKGGFDSYRIYYKKTGEGHEWFHSDLLAEDLDQTSTEGELKLYELEPDTGYEARAQGKKRGIPGPYTEIIKFRTMPIRPAYCGDPALLPEGETGAPYLEAIKGDIVNVDGMEMTLLNVVHLGDGWYKGLGRVSVDYFGGAAFTASFDRIFINTEHQVVLGRIDFVTNGAAVMAEEQLAAQEEREEERNENDLANNDNAHEQKDITFEGVIDSLFVDGTGEIVIIDTEGERVVYEQPVDSETGGILPMNIVDSGGNEYVVDSEGKVAKGGSGNGIEDVVSDTEAKRDKYLKFIIAGTDYMDGDNYYTMYTKKELEIKVEQTDTVARDLSGITWELEGNKMTPDKDDPNILRLRVKKGNLPKSSNELLVLDSVGNKISKLKIQTYRGPEIVFDEANIYNGEYLFDHGHEFNPILSNYESFSIGPNNATYYAPVLGILKGGHATVRVNVKQLKSEASKDPDFSVVIKPELPGKIKIDGQDSLILNANTLGSTKTIIIEATNFINAKDLSPMKIIAYLPSTGERVGMMEYYCAKREKKEVKLIYVKFSNESAYPNYLVTSTLETFLEDQSMNQLFLDFDLTTVQYNSKYTTSQVQKWKQDEILDSLNLEYFGSKRPSGYGTQKNYYYVTNLVIKTSSGSNVGAFHYTGGNGGVQMKYQTTAHGETAEEATAHEFGHWMGLPHTWGTSKNVSVIVNPTQGGTRDNFMDYKIRRKKWFKHQLLKHNHR